MSKDDADYGCLLIVIAITVALLTAVFRSSAQTVTVGDDNFLIEYDTTMLVPRSVQWTLTTSDVGTVRRVSAWRFIQDKRISGRQATETDYLRSGYDKGHMCPAADRSFSVATMRSTFIMSNVAPQKPTVNRGEWSRIEANTRKYVRGGHALKVTASVVFWQADTTRIGKNHVCVPHAFVKTIRLLENDSIIYSKYVQND